MPQVHPYHGFSIHSAWYFNFLCLLLTGLTIGSYLFELSVIDETKNNASASVLVTVVQGMFRDVLILK